jgi:hypothetical protein
LHEVLELPGHLYDYHFAIQSTYMSIFEQRREDLAMLQEVERLCWLDIELLEAHPEMVQSELGKYFHVRAYDILIRLYETEGDFAGALEVAEQGKRLGQEEYLAKQADRLRARLAELEAEDMPW